MPSRFAPLLLGQARIAAALLWLARLRSLERGPSPPGGRTAFARLRGSGQRSRSVSARVRERHLGRAPLAPPRGQGSLRARAKLRAPRAARGRELPRECPRSPPPRPLARGASRRGP